jgi:hypothetical protein
MTPQSVCIMLQQTIMPLNISETLARKRKQGIPNRKVLWQVLVVYICRKSQFVCNARTP